MESDTRIAEVSPDCLADYVELRLEPANTEGKTVRLQPEEGAQAQPDVVAPRLGPAGLAPNAVNYAALFRVLTLFAERISCALANTIFGPPGGLSFFLCGQSRAFFSPSRV